MTDAVVLDTPEAIDWFRVTVIIRALKMEVEHGIKMTRISPIPACRSYGFKGRTKKQALEFMENFKKENYPT